MWAENLSKLYNPGENLTVDEQLVELRGHCLLKQYVPSKPAKYHNFETVRHLTLSKIQAYKGTEEGAPANRNQFMRIVCELNWEMKGHKMKCDNFFTS